MKRSVTCESRYFFPNTGNLKDFTFFSPSFLLLPSGGRHSKSTAFGLAASSASSIDYSPSFFLFFSLTSIGSKDREWDLGRGFAKENKEINLGLTGLGWRQTGHSVFVFFCLFIYFFSTSKTKVHLISVVHKFLVRIQTNNASKVEPLFHFEEQGWLKKRKVIRRGWGFTARPDRAGLISLWSFTQNMQQKLLEVHKCDRRPFA